MSTLCSIVRAGSESGNGERVGVPTHDRWNLSTMPRHSEIELRGPKQNNKVGSRSSPGMLPALFSQADSESDDATVWRT
eukprot:7780055-Alexandrium_andersonii.AAC.1